MKKRTVIWYIGNGFLAIGAAIALYALTGTYLLYRDLPAGACPFDANRPLLYVALGLVVVSLILSFFEKKPESLEK